MKRTQIYLDDDLHKILVIESKQRRKRMSNLIREALREKYLKEEKKLHLLESIQGIWKDRNEDVDDFIRKRRSGSRLKALYE